MKKIKLILVPFLFVLMMGLVNAIVAVDHGLVQNHLRLSIPGCIPIGEDPDPWLVDSCITGDSSFDLIVFNNHTNLNSSNTNLVIGINTLPEDITILIDNETVTGYLNTSVPYQGFGPHGVFPDFNITTGDSIYDEPRYWAEHGIGPIPGGSSVTVHVDILDSNDATKVHFDAVGFDEEGTLHLRSAFSADTTVLIPEFTTIGAVLVLLGSGLYARFRRRK